MQNCTEPNERWVDEGETATAASVWKMKKKVKDFTSCTRKLFYVLTFFGRFRSFFPQVNVTRSSVYPSELRFRREYVLWYKNVFEFLAKGELNSRYAKTAARTPFLSTTSARRADPAGPADLPQLPGLRRHQEEEEHRAQARIEEQICTVAHT